MYFCISYFILTTICSLYSVAMLKFLVASSSLLSVAQGLGIVTYDWPSNLGANTAVATPLKVLDLIAANNNKIKLDSDDASTTYLGLWPTGDMPTSHTEQATGGPITKIACAGVTSDCLLPLYQNGDVMDPVPKGDYDVIAVNGNDLTYSTAVSATKLAVTIDPYISAWGSTLMQAMPIYVERGDDLMVTWDGLDAGDVIEYRLAGGASVTDCAVAYYTITTADAALGRGTISLKTTESQVAGKTMKNLVPFVIAGRSHTISMITSAGKPDYSSSCSTLGALATATSIRGTARTFMTLDSDSIVTSPNNGAPIEAGTKTTVTYNLATATTSGTYVGLWLGTEIPSSHVVDPDHTTGHPLSVAFLPVGVSGTGVIELSIPITAENGYHIVYIFNSNDAAVYFTPLAETSYGSLGGTGPHHVTSTNVDTMFDVIAAPTGEPTGQPSDEPTGQPSGVPTSPTGQPTGVPTSAPSFVEEPWGEYVWTEKRHRKAGMCENQCSGHGTCEVNGNCKCFAGLDGEDEWTGPDCSSRTCPFDFAWVGLAINANNLHPWAECSNKGTCDRGSGECQCFTGYEGAACQRTVCPDNCNDQGTCWPEKHLASKAGRVYEAPWDAMKHVGCLCDAGYRGPACDQQECPSGADPLSGYGNEAGRDCSGRGVCDYSSGICACFTGFFGTKCQHQSTVM
jgi:hypothetical protein